MPKPFLWPAPSLDHEKIFPPASPAPVFIECGQCGGWHSRNLPGSIDCRDDRHRFAIDELDARYGAFGWEEIGLDDQERDDGCDP